MGKAGDEAKPRVAVHKFSSCDGCQLAFLDLGEDLVRLAELVDFVHFAEAGPVDPEAETDIAFVEGSISTPGEAERIKRIRANTRYLVPIGACATSGGIQALRNLHDGKQWLADVYPSPEYVESLATSTGIADNVTVDYQLWGCPVNGRQVLAAVRALLWGVDPVPERDKVCMECKRAGHVCVLVSRGQPCLGPVTVTGCGALCPAFGRDCYGCYGPAENPNPDALGRRFEGLGLMREDVARRFHFIHSHREPLHGAGLRWGGGGGRGP
ncbi:sulfhydrogenase subunit delta [Thiohalorhabdus denitrificans]|uniref:Coenzyme F420-reducing hydrogenase, gamma subunit n=1 Tax=Thiohalorhabdus denitrificans TaxID=381306 RepID=A0A0P9C3V9_9GAMM|nr:sulfhydrogenase subunit delta [Thiohalorhabdus denitrificans]KPV39668.1 sulfhydrogenase subunit delta [Thiohalorhabdus denitrificans]SCX94755.1 Coenzyme F420-reducing hydrogenase, gamma subunit [Thiohalorhabdus denitrificans]